MSVEIDLKRWAGIENDGDGVTLAVAFTDIIDSTKLAKTAGNQAMFALLRKHFERARVHCRYHRGFEIKLIGNATQREITNEYGKNPEGFRVVSLGRVRPMKGFSSSEPVYEVVSPELRRARQARQAQLTAPSPPSSVRGATTSPELRPPQPESQPRWITEMKRVSLPDPPSFPTRKKPHDK